MAPATLRVGRCRRRRRGSLLLWPFENYATFCPYLVGSYEIVASELQRYMTLGFRAFILDIPPSEEDLHHTGVVFDRARAAQLP